MVTSCVPNSVIRKEDLKLKIAHQMPPYVVPFCEKESC